MSDPAMKIDACLTSGTRAVPALPLAMAGIGERRRIVRIVAGRGLCQRLSAMGLVPGAAIEVLSDGGRGPMIVALKGSRIVLGRGMAFKVLVE